MRTTIELRPEHRARLLELSARRGEKGFSSVIAEAIETYLVTSAAAERRNRRALQQRGRLNAREAEELRRAVSRIREQWR